MTVGRLAVRVTTWLALACAPRAALGYEFEVTARSEGYGYQLRRYGREGLALVNRRRVTQYLGLYVFDLFGTRASAPTDNRQGISAVLHAQLRFFSDFGSYAEPAQAIAELRNDEFELMTAAIDVEGLLDCLRLRLGRQYEPDLFDFFGYDGLSVVAKLPAGLFVRGHFGRQINRLHAFSPAVLQVDGTSGDDDSSSFSPTAGFSVGLSEGSPLALRFSYRRAWSRADAPGLPGEPSPRRLSGVDQEFVAFRAGYRLPRLGLSSSFAGRYNLLLSAFDDLQLSTWQRIGASQLVSVDAVLSRPHFDGDSIFNIFDNEPYGELAGRYSFGADRELALETRLGCRWFWHGRHEVGAQSTAISATAVARLTKPRWFARGEVHWIRSLGDQRIGGELQTSWLISRRFTAQGRATLIHYADRSPELADVTTLSMQLGLDVRLLREVKLMTLVEQHLSRLYRSNTRLIAILDMRFAP